MRFRSSAWAALLIFIFGAVVGPVLIAGISALHDDEQGMYAESEASKLITAYQAKLPPGYLFRSMPLPDEGRKCGYDPRELFPDGIEEMAAARAQAQFSDYEGYYALEAWASDLKDKAWLAEIASEIDKSISRVEIEFLRRCIDATIFASVCMQRVDKFGDRVDRYPEVDRSAFYAASGFEQEVICTYLDAVAKRRGLPVPSR